MVPVSVTAALLLPQPGVIHRSGRCASGSPLPVTARLFSWLLVLILLLVAPFALATPTTPTEDFTDNLDGTVTHRITGLTWMRCAMGMTWTGTTCTGTASSYNWDEATKLTLSFAGKSDWRLPSIAELNTIVERAAYVPTINSEVFPITPPLKFWSSSPYIQDPNSGWVVFFDAGYTNGGFSASWLYAIRLVRSSVELNPLAPATPTVDFVDNGDGTVTHLRTGLMWKRCAEGQTWTGTTCGGRLAQYDWSTASAISSSTAGYSDWRLPTTNELLTIVEYRSMYPAINGNIFPAAVGQSDYASVTYWSSTKADATGRSQEAWYVEFSTGSAWVNPIAGARNVRLSRVGQFFSSYGFAKTTEAPLNSFIASNPLKISSVTGTLPISVVGGSYSVNGQAFKTGIGYVAHGDSVAVRLLTAANYSTRTRVSLTVGTITGDFVVTTLAAPDNQMPTVPVGVSVAAIDDNKIKLAWSPSSDNSGVTAYRIRRNGKVVATVASATGYVDSGLNPAATYEYQLSACDQVNNCSAFSVPISVSTISSHALSHTTPTSDFIDNGDGTVTHRKTGLTWMRCDFGQSWNGKGCDGGVGGYTWDQARSISISFAGKSDWRMPTIYELNSIVEYGSNPAFNLGLFPSVPLWSFYWSSSSYSLIPGASWVVHTLGQTASVVAASEATFPMRPVRSETPVSASTQTAPASDFLDNGDGTVTHLRTGLMWKRCSEGQSWTGSTCSGTATFHDWGSALSRLSTTAGYGDWRLPAANELLTIVEYQRDSPAINLSVFPETPAITAYWTASTVAFNTSSAWKVNFREGLCDQGASKDAYLNVRLVRNSKYFGSAGFPTLVGASSNSVSTSNSLTVGLISHSSPIRITNGQYSINSGPYTSAAGTINPNDSVTVRVTSAPTPGTTTIATLTIGTISGDFAVTTAVDAQPPVAPSSLSASTVTPTPVTAGIKLTWPASTDNTAVTHYRLYRNGALLAVVSSPTTSYTDTQLSNSNQFSYTVQACDAAYNCSALSSTASTTRTGTVSITPQLATGAGHSAGIKNDGSLFTWGFNDAGQLGIGTSGAPSTSPQRPSASQASVYTSVATGTSHTLALKLDGTLWTWGGNASGQLGDGTTTSHNAPTQISTGYMLVAAGSSHSLAIKLDGTLWSWGNSGTGQLGDGTSNSSSTPIQVGSDFYTVSAGTSHTVAIKTDGTLWAWGSNNFGQLGDATGNDRYAPQLIGSGFTAVAAGAFHTLALKNDGTLWAWGQNTNGQLGDNTTQNRYAPVQIGSGYSVIPGTLAAGNAHSLALKPDGSLWAWGSNTSGQLGDGTTTDSTTPKAINPATAFTTIAANANHSLALKPDGTVWSWGANNTGQLGDATLASRLTSVLVLNETVDGVLDLIPEVTNNIPTDKIPAFLVQVAKAASVTSTVKYNSDDLNKNGSVYVVAYLDPASPLIAGTTPAVKSATTTKGGTPIVAAVLTRSGWKQTSSTTPTEPLYSGALTTSTNTFSMYDAALFDQTKDNGLFCVSYAGSSTTSAKGLIRSVVSGVDANLNQCPPIQIGSTADTAAPSIPLNITATAAGPGQVNLSWSAATDNVGVAHYNIYRGTSLIATVSNVTSYTDTSPQASTAYSYSVMACDIALNCSGQSTNAQTNTPAQPSVILSPGWNLVGNGGSTAMNVASLFGDTSKVYSLWKWVRSGNTPGISYPTWALYAPGQADGGAAYAASKGYEALTSIQSAEGFWVNAKAAMSVPMTAPAWTLSNTFQPNQSNALPTGWSLIATGEANTASSFNKAIGSTPPTPGQIPSNLTTLWAWENSTSRWYFYAPSLEAAGTLQGYVSDKGYLDFGNLTLTPTAGVWVNR